MAAPPTAHELISLVAAGALLYYRITPMPAPGPAIQDKIRRLTLLLATSAHLYRVDQAGACHRLTEEETKLVTSAIEDGNWLQQRHSQESDVAILSGALARITQELLERAPDDY